MLTRDRVTEKKKKRQMCSLASRSFLGWGRTTTAWTINFVTMNVTNAIKDSQGCQGPKTRIPLQLWHERRVVAPTRMDRQGQGSHSLCNF